MATLDACYAWRRMGCCRLMWETETGLGVHCQKNLVPEQKQGRVEGAGAPLECLGCAQVTRRSGAGVLSEESAGQVKRSMTKE